MVVGVVIARERCVVMGVLVMEAVADDVVHACVSGDETGSEVEDVEEGDTVEEVDVDVCMVWYLSLRRLVPFLLKDEPGDGLVAAVEPVDSEEEEAEEEDIDNRMNIIMQYFQ
ncbi:hypothetical protein NDU88_000420 [Pleurodeles waltl]|uniref:Uncharacterized protein n=1 Tax=Pleurodeles waltl TaxID=8319 RepID=A0AAV7TEZ5_PLEWA|nr:hypothetical protein NDU88_000420 [Pleurodeles waltl]